jgi:hypothetical protein
MSVRSASEILVIGAHLGQAESTEGAARASLKRTEGTPPRPRQEVVTLVENGMMTVPEERVMKLRDSSNEHDAHIQIVASMAIPEPNRSEAAWGYKHDCLSESGGASPEPCPQRANGEPTHASSPRHSPSQTPDMRCTDAAASRSSYTGSMRLTQPQPMPLSPWHPNESADEGKALKQQRCTEPPPQRRRLCGTAATVVSAAAVPVWARPNRRFPCAAHGGAAFVQQVQPTHSPVSPCRQWGCCSHHRLSESPHHEKRSGRM